MRKFTVENNLWELFPNARIGIVICTGIDNTIKDTESYEKMISDAYKECVPLYRTGRRTQAG